MVSPIELKIVIVRATDGFDVMAETEASGRAGPEPLDWESLQTPEFQALLAQIRDEPRSTRFETFRTVGETIFEAVFRGKVRRLFLGLYDQRVQPQPDAALRLRLDITESAAELAALPWEFLFWRGTPVGTQIQTLLVRDLASIDFGGREPLAMAGKPRVLLVIPRGSDLQTDRERDRVLSILNKAEIPCDVVEGRVTLQRVDDVLAERDYHILHFIGHGDAEVGEDGRLQGRLRFNTPWVTDEAVDVDWVEDDRIQSLLSSYRSLRLVILNACEGGETGVSEGERSGRGFVGMAPAILRAGVPAVVAMQYKIGDSVAIQFAETFYKRLTSERWAGEVDRAVAMARNACYLGSRDDRGFATPVLFLRAIDGRLFSFPDWVPPDPSIPPPEPAPDLSGFVGREEDLAYYGAILAGRHFAVITGMPGVGKSLLAAKLAQSMVSSPGKLFWHRFHEGEGTEVIIWRLAALLARNGQTELWKLLNQPNGIGDPSRPIETLFNHVFRLVQNQGYVICLDDFQHVDADPLVGKLIEQLAKVVHAGEVKLIITSRRMPDFVTTVSFRPLAGLDRRDVAALFAARGVQSTAEQLDSIYDQTAGNAELINLTIDVLQHTASPDRIIARLVATEDVENYLFREVDKQLTVEERTVMGAFAILLGQAGTRAAIESVLGGENNPSRSLLSLRNRYLLDEKKGETGRLYSQHAMVQSFYYELLSQRERQRMHIRAAAFYETEEPDLLRAAQHYFRAGEYEHSAQLATADVNGALNRGQMGLLRHLFGQYLQAQLQPDTWARVLLGRGKVAYVYGEYDEACQWYQTAAEMLSHLPQQTGRRILQADVCRQMAQVLMEQSPNEALVWLRRGLEHLADLQTLEQTADLHIASGAALIHLGQFDAAEAEIEAGLGLLPADALEARIDALLNLSVIHSSRGDLGKSTACTSEALPLAERRGDLFRLIKIHNSRAVDLIVDGKWQDARDDLKEALRLGERVVSKSDQAKVDLNLGSLYSKMGDEQTALSHWARSLELARKNDLNEMICAVQASTAEVFLWQGELVRAEASLDEAQTLAEHHSFQDLLPEIWRKRSQLRLVQGRMTEAEQDAARSVELAETLSLDAELGISLRVLAEANTALAPTSTAAREYLQRSLALLEGVERHEAGRTQAALGHFLLAQGDAEAARGLWAEAQNSFRALGAQRDLALVSALLSTLPDSTSPVFALPEVENASPRTT